MMCIWLLLISLIVNGCNSSHNTVKPSGIQASLDEISQNEKEDLDAFFNQLISRGGAYTLFGNKPITTIWYSGYLDWRDIENTVVCTHGWKTWVKHQQKFPSRTYSIKRIRFSESDWQLFLINKTSTIKEIDKNILLFKRTLGSSLTAEEIWKQMDASDDFFLSVTQRHDLLGILLGYGTENSCAFQRAGDLNLYFSQQLAPPFRPSSEWDALTSEAKECVSLYVNRSKPTTLQPLRPQFGYPTLAAELNSLQRNSFDLSEFDHQLDYFSPPAFAVFHDNRETKQLKEDYLTTYELLGKLSRSRFQLETVLKQWTQGYQ